VPDNVRHVLVLEPVGTQQPAAPTASDVGLPVYSKDAPPAKPGAKGASKP
jgi:hypothetical protein